VFTKSANSFERMYNCYQSRILCPDLLKERDGLRRGGETIHEVSALVVCVPYIKLVDEQIPPSQHDLPT
jgi:hypothetical protein